MISLRDLSLGADQNVRLGKEIFDKEGILVVKGFLPGSVVQTVESFLRHELDRLEVLYRQYGISIHGEDAAARLATLVSQSAATLPEAHRHTFLGHFPLEVRLAETLREIPRFINTQPLLFELLSATRLFAHMPPTARYVLPHCSLARVPLHQDISYNRHMGDFCVVWVPLVPIDMACGGMAAYAKTQEAAEMVVERQHAAADGWLPPIDSGPDGDAERVVLAPLDPGDLVIMSKRTMHESMPNESGRLRLSCDFRFFGERSHSTKHYLDIAANTVVPPAPAQ
jgi:Phytanoyl-CoA dioxygenase (PhyH)